MAFKMRGFNPGQGTGMGSAFLKDDKNVANNPNKRDPEDGADVNPSSINKDVPTKEVKTTETHTPTKRQQRRHDRKTARAAKLREKAEKLRSKKGTKTKKAERLERRATRKEKKADWVEGKADNILAGKEGTIKRRSDLTKETGPRKNPISGNVVEKTKEFGEEGMKDKKTTKTTRPDGTVKTVVKDKVNNTKTKTDTKNESESNKPKEMSFGDAFKGARSEGKKIFEYKGKKYHTRRADESKEDWEKKFNAKGTPSPGAEPEKKKINNTKKEDNKKEDTKSSSSVNPSVTKSNVSSDIVHTSGGSIDTKTNKPIGYGYGKS